MRLLFDENLSAVSANWARSALGVNVVDARTAGLGRSADAGVRKFAIETDRILVTLDGDFANLVRFSPADTLGIIWLRARPPTETSIRFLLGKWLHKLSEINLRDRLAVVEADELRIRGAIQKI